MQFEHGLHYWITKYENSQKLLDQPNRLSRYPPVRVHVQSQIYPNELDSMLLVPLLSTGQLLVCTLYILGL
jgi:hypothetical protein